MGVFLGNKTGLSDRVTNVFVSANYVCIYTYVPNDNTFCIKVIPIFTNTYVYSTHVYMFAGAA